MSFINLLLGLNGDRHSKSGFISYFSVAVPNTLTKAT